MKPDALMLPLDRLLDPLPIPPLSGPFDAAIRPPGSKSISNRALLLAALAKGTSTLRGALVDADDAHVMIQALEQLGAKIEIGSPPGVLRVTGVAGRWKTSIGSAIALDLHNAGTATRFLTAAALLAPPGTSIAIDGDTRMRERPIGELGDALAALGGRVEYLGARGFPPLRISPASAIHDSIALGTTASGQFISALFLIAPFLPRGLAVEFTGSITSPAYIHMTLAMLRRVGVHVEGLPPARTRVGNAGANGLPAFDLEIEPDASGASYFWAAAALTPGARAVVQGLSAQPEQSLQGDMAFLDVLAEMGAIVERAGAGAALNGVPTLSPIDADLSDMPDTAMTAAVVACFASPTPENPTATSTLRGLRTLRVKETDRLEALGTELSKIRARVEIYKERGDEGLRITPPAQSPAPTPPFPVVFDTYNDHRMAMSLALIGLRRPGVAIRSPSCVRKTYPTYWRDFARLYGS